MFDSKNYKKMALAQLKGRWQMPCIFSLISTAINCLVGYASKNGFAWNILEICITGILDVALISVFLKMIDLKANISFQDFLDGLEKWIRALLCALWFDLWVCLWTLLFVIPGIVKGISYSMMFWVIAENPKIEVSKAMKISKILTDGHKADLFGMTLSFCGWFFLSLLSAGIGFIWLIPYVHASFTNTYLDLKKMAFEKGSLKPADFMIAE